MTKQELTLEDAQAGALRFKRIIVNDRSEQVSFDVAVLFDDGILSDLRRMVRDAGFPEYPERPSKGKSRETIAQSFTGSVPSLADANDHAASLACVLVEIAKAEWRLQQAMALDRRDEMYRLGVRMGRLAEWWRWRSEGHDRRAHGKRRSEEHLGEARKARAINQNFGADWHLDAREMASELRAKNAKRSRHNIAEELAAKFNVSVRHMTDVIKMSIPRI